MLIKENNCGLKLIKMVTIHKLLCHATKTIFKAFFTQFISTLLRVLLSNYGHFLLLNKNNKPVNKYLFNLSYSNFTNILKIKNINYILLIFNILYTILTNSFTIFKKII